jgi:hypothetical protein
MWLLKIGVFGPLGAELRWFSPVDTRHANEIFSKSQVFRCDMIAEPYAIVCTPEQLPILIHLTSLYAQENWFAVPIANADSCFLIGQ